MSLIAITLIGYLPFQADTPKAPMLWWPEAANGVCPNGVHTSYQRGVGLLDSESVQIRWELTMPDFWVQQNPYGPTVWDVDLDGTPEILTIGSLLSPEEEIVLVVIEGPTGRIEWILPMPKGLRGIGVYSPPVADLDGDGHPEIVVNYCHSYSGWALVWTVAVDGVTRTAKWKNIINAKISVPPLCPSIGDVDGDGRLEVVVGLPYIVYCLNGEDGSLLWRKDSLGARVPAIADMDGDGISEIICSGGNATNTATALSGRDGSVVWEAIYGNGDSGIVAISEPTIADADADGKLEVIFAGTYAYKGPAPNIEFSVFWLDGKTGRLERRYAVSKHCALSEHPLPTGQLDSDPAQETLIWFWNRGIICLDGLTAQEQWRYPVPCESTVVDGMSICDIDSDGENEVIAYAKRFQPWPPSNARIICLSGSGNLEWEIGFPNEHEVAGIPTLADVDNDGYLEIVLSRRESFYDTIMPLTVRCIDNEPALTGQEAKAPKAPELRALPGKVTVFLPDPCPVDLSLYDMNGRRIKELYKGQLPPGTHEFGLRGLEPGVYLAELRYDGRITTKAVVMRR